VNVASQEYLHNAVTYFRKKYGKVLFIVASNGMEWTKKNMPKDIIVKYIQGTTEADLAIKFDFFIIIHAICNNK
jgi:hypothetical protein